MEAIELKSNFQSALQELSKDLRKYHIAPPYSLISRIYAYGIEKDIELINGFFQIPSKILDFGCGMGEITLALSKCQHCVVGIDVEYNPESKFLGQEEKQGKLWSSLKRKSSCLEYSFYDGKNLPFLDKSFDCVVAYAVIEHISPEDLNYILEEINRILKDKGILFIFKCPRKKSYAEHLSKLFKLSPHRLLTEKALKELLEKNHFDILVFGRTDFIISGLPGILQRLWNRLTPFLLIVDKALLKTPLKYFAHNVYLVAAKRTRRYIF